mgnify:CR=1 FL=1
MVLKIAIPGKMKFKMMRREPYLLHRKGDVHYIGGAEVLPPPLPSEQENQVIGDLGTEYEDEAKAILIEHNLRLVVYIAKKFDNTGVGVEDLISIGTIGLIKAINTFNPVKNIKLATYASRCIENEILMYFRSQRKLQGELSLRVKDSPLSVNSSHAVHINTTSVKIEYAPAACPYLPLPKRRIPVDTAAPYAIMKKITFSRNDTESTNPPCILPLRSCCAGWSRGTRTPGISSLSTICAWWRTSSRSITPKAATRTT